MADKPIFTIDIETINCQNRQQVDVLIEPAIEKQNKALDEAQHILDAALLESEATSKKWAAKIAEYKKERTELHNSLPDGPKKDKSIEVSKREIKKMREKMREEVETPVKKAEENFAFVNEQTDPANNQEIQDIFRKTGVVAFRGAIFCIVMKEIRSGRKFKAMAPLDRNFRQSENAMIRNAFSWMNSLGPSWPVLTGFNIIGFDLPFLDMRALSHDIRRPPYLLPANRWNHPNHFDVMDRMTHWNAFGKNCPSVHEALAFFGLPSHKGEMDGSKVWAEVQAGNYDKVLDYCEQDVEAEVLLVEKFLPEIEGILLKDEVRSSRFSS